MARSLFWPIFCFGSATTNGVGLKLGCHAGATGRAGPMVGG